MRILVVVHMTEVQTLINGRSDCGKTIKGIGRFFTMPTGKVERQTIRMCNFGPFAEHISFNCHSGGKRLKGNVYKTKHTNEKIKHLLENWLFNMFLN